MFKFICKKLALKRLLNNINSFSAALSMCFLLNNSDLFYWEIIKFISNLNTSPIRNY